MDRDYGSVIGAALVRGGVQARESRFVCAESWNQKTVMTGFGLVSHDYGVVKNTPAVEGCS